MSDSTDVQLALINKSLELMTADMAEVKERRREVYMQFEEVKRELIGINNRLTNLEESEAKNTAITNDYQKYKHKVEAAGTLGKWLWAIGGVLLGAAASSRSFILHWLGINP